MIRKIGISVIFFFASLSPAITQTTLITISGHVTNTNGGFPVPNHEIYITADSINNPVFSYFNIVMTDPNGYYKDSLFIPTNSQIIFDVFTFDCVNNIHNKTLVSTNPPLIADFQICDSINNNCFAFYTAFPDSLNPLAIHFIDLSSPNIDNWLWEFGDGTTSTLKNPVHHYPDTGLYSVCLTVSKGMPGTSNYCEDTFCDSIFVLLAMPPCHSDFSIVNDPINPLTFNFLNNSAGIFNEVFWNFGDGNHSSDFSPTHTYLNPGTYNVCLKIFHINPISFDTLCSDIKCKQLIIPPPDLHHLAGQVFSNFFPVVICDIFLYKIQNNGNIIPVDSTIIDTNGVYFFYQIPDGNYLVKARPLPNSPVFNQGLPTYFGNALHWINADIIHLHANFFNANIDLLPYQYFGGGPGSIEGKIEFGGKNPSKGIPAQGIEILLLDMQNFPLEVDYSDNNGIFKFNDLPFGTYRVYAEIAGKNTIPVQVNIDPGNLIVSGINLVITNNAVIASMEDNITETIKSISEIYPNPSADIANIEINIQKTTNIELKIINPLGQVIMLEEHALQTGENRLSVDISELGNGIYYMQIIDFNNNKFTRKFIKSN